MKEYELDKSDFDLKYNSSAADYYKRQLQCIANQ